VKGHSNLTTKEIFSFFSEQSDLQTKADQKDALRENKICEKPKLAM
jgi:hypothetical protein